VGLAFSIFTMVAAMAQAPVALKATYTVGRGPCQWLPDGSRRWPLRGSWAVDTVYRGTVGADSIGLDAAAVLENGAQYHLFLRPGPTGEHEVVAILKSR
jgi:hypothetical protein